MHQTATRVQRKAIGAGGAIERQPGAQDSTVSLNRRRSTFALRAGWLALIILSAALVLAIVILSDNSNSLGTMHAELITARNGPAETGRSDATKTATAGPPTSPTASSTLPATDPTAPAVSGTSPRLDSPPSTQLAPGELNGPPLLNWLRRAHNRMAQVP